MVVGYPPFSGFEGAAVAADSFVEGGAGAEGQSLEPARRGGGPPSDDGSIALPMGLPNFDELLCLPLTYGELLATAALPRCFRAFANKMGMMPSTLLRHFLAVPEEDLVQTLNEIVEEGGLASPLERGELVDTIRILHMRAGAEPPRLGAGGLPVATTRLPTQRPMNLALLPAVPAPPPVALLAIPLRKFLDQSLTGDAQPMSRGELSAARARYEAEKRKEPEPEATPTSDQLSALNTLILAGRAPYTDFAVWNVWGPRLAKQADTEVSILVGTEWITKRIAAPSSYAAWRASWDLFETAMISLSHADQGALGRYQKGIEKLSRLFPHNWDIVLSTDLLVRSERWQALREKYSRHLPMSYDDSNPWGYVIACSAFGGGLDPEMASWWSTMLVIPCSKSSSSAEARKTIGDVEGVMCEHLERARPDLRGGGGGSGRGRSRSPRRPPGHAAGDTRATSLCPNWNARTGACGARSGPCRLGLTHGFCNICGKEGHRSCDAHGDSSKGKGKDKFKGKNKDKGKGKNKKGSETDSR